jgi:polyhydroxyalkanoate synthesis regulator phasin
MAKRKNIMTGFLEDIIDDTKDFVDDILDRAKDVESDLKDAVQDVTDDDEKASVPTNEVAALHVALADLTAKVNQLAELQLAAAKA